MFRRISWFKIFRKFSKRRLFQNYQMWLEAVLSRAPHWCYICIHIYIYVHDKHGCLYISDEMKWEMLVRKWLYKYKTIDCCMNLYTTTCCSMLCTLSFCWDRYWYYYNNIKWNEFYTQKKDTQYIITYILYSKYSLLLTSLQWWIQFLNKNFQSK